MKKSRNWAFVMYPESMPENWLEIITQTGLPTAISPLHDKDLNPDNEEKKSHYHVIVKYDGPTTYNHVLEFTKLLNATIPIPLESIKGMYRYHIHQDNPEKYQYSDYDRLLLNGFDSNSVNELTKTEVLALEKQIIIFIKDNKIIEYSDLLDLLLDNDLNQMFEVACSHTILINTYITSYRNSIKQI